MYLVITSVAHTIHHHLRKFYQLPRIASTGALAMLVGVAYMKIPLPVVFIDLASPFSATFDTFES